MTAKSIPVKIPSVSLIAGVMLVVCSYWVPHLGTVLFYNALLVGAIG